MTTQKISITDFKFVFTGHGHYNVVYTSPTTGSQWSTTTTDMHLIDATRNAEQPMTKDLNRLKYLCKLSKRIYSQLN
jgi:hypothetical protein